MPINPFRHVPYVPPDPPRPKAPPPIRHMLGSDIPNVLALEAEAYGADAWDRDRFDRLRNSRHSYAFIYERHGRVLGFICYSLRPHSIELLRLAVASRWRRQGIGAALLERATTYLTVERPRAHAVLSEDLEGGHKFLRSQGWQAIEVMREWTDNGRDAYGFVRDIVEV